MSDDDIDLDRVINDPAYRRAVIDRLNAETGAPRDQPSPETVPGGVHATSRSGSRYIRET